MICNSPLMTPEECAGFIERHEWRQLRMPDESNLELSAGYLRNNGVIARISKLPPVSMFRIGQRMSLWVVKEQEEMAERLIQELQQRFTNCPRCGHVLLVEEEECSYCDEEMNR